MKNVFALLAFFFFTITITAQQEKLTITFADGTEITGIGRIRDNYSILYRKERKAKKEIYSHKTGRKVRKVTFHTEDGDRQFEYKVVAGTAGVGSIIPLEIVKEGRINLYQKINSIDTNPGMMNPGIMNMSYDTAQYFMGKQGDDLVVNLREGNTYSKRFRKRMAPKYFKDCPDLMSKINTRKFFKRYGIHAIVDYYNEKCE